MSFRLFVYFSALCGTSAAMVGWLCGRLLGRLPSLAESGLKGALLGFMVAVALSIVDSRWNTSGGMVSCGLRVCVAAVGSVAGGLLGGIIGQALCLLTANTLLGAAFTIFGWTITGLMLGASLGVFDLVVQLASGRPAGGALRKLRNTVLGGTTGGILGSLLYLLLIAAWASFFRNKPFDKLWSPSATGFAALGACLGLFIGLAQVVLKEAWLRVEAGYRAGRELIISKDALSIGRAEGCDIGLFGDAAIEKVHARIERREGRYLLADTGGSAGTYLKCAVCWRA